MNNKTDPDFIHFLQSMVNLDALHEMTTDLDNDLKDSQTVMNEIKGMIEALPPRVANPGDGCMQHEDIANLLEAGTPHLLMPDMEVNIDLNLDDVIATMKSYVEDIKKNFTVSDPLTQPKQSPKELESLELEKYASNLDHLCKKLTHLKLTKKAEKKSDVELEAKLSLLCEDVQTFNKMIQAKTALNEGNNSWPTVPQTASTLGYENLVNKLLTDIEGVSCLLQNRN